MEKVSGKLSDRVSWIKDLVNLEDQMEDSGLVEMENRGTYDQEKILAQETHFFMQILKDEFIQASQFFNELKSSTLGRIKIYGIAKTQNDFMLFRNGFKMIFAFQSPGIISIRFNFISPNSYLAQHNAGDNSYFNPHQNPPLMEEQILVAHRGPLDEIKWCYADQPVAIESIIKYHMSLFVKESAK